MTHILASKIRSLHDVRFHQAVGAVRVRRVGNALHMELNSKESSLAIAKWDVVWVPLPDDIPILCRGATLSPMFRFWITVETLDPCHLVCDRPEPR